MPSLGGKNEHQLVVPQNLCQNKIHGKSNKIDDNDDDGNNNRMESSPIPKESKKEICKEEGETLPK